MDHLCRRCGGAALPGLRDPLCQRCHDAKSEAAKDRRARWKRDRRARCARYLASAARAVERDWRDATSEERPRLLALVQELRALASSLNTPAASAAQHPKEIS